MTTEHPCPMGAPSAAPLPSTTCTARAEWVEPVSPSDPRPYALWDVCLATDPYVGFRLTMQRTDAEDGTREGVSELALSRSELESLARALPALVMRLAAAAP